VGEDKIRGRGLKVIISVPQGEELAKRTLNRRLGIVGGISILGTSGVVIPYSTQAYKLCISQALDVAVATGCREVVLTTGRRSERFAQRELKLPEEAFVQMGDFVGYTLEECAKRKLARVTIWGMVGKISKIAAGHLYTHVSNSQLNMNFLVGVAASCGVSEMVEAVNAHHFLKLLDGDKVGEVANKLCLLAARQCLRYAGKLAEVECIMSDNNGVILGRACVQG
jgi:cobalt-precorrin-5B (C1)-methyltransferase